MSTVAASNKDLYNDQNTNTQSQGEVQVTISNAHSDLIHDAVLDYYGKRLATCSSDKTIKIFEVSQPNSDANENANGNPGYVLLDTLSEHTGPVWQVDWAHPKFGTCLASCGYDGKICIWKENSNKKFELISVLQYHTASVNSVQWAPHEYGPLLLCSSSDGSCSIVEFKDNGVVTEPIILEAHQIGVNAACWAPITFNGGDNSNSKRFVTGGCDNLVKIWKSDESSPNKYVLEHTLKGHSDWVRDVAWSPSVLNKSYIATVGQDSQCVIWTKDQESKENEWKQTFLKEGKFDDVLWRASWSLSGDVLALSGGDNRITLWRENLQGKWESAGEINE